MLAATIGTFVGVIASFFPDRLTAAAHVGFSVSTSVAALVAAGVSWATIVGLQVVVLALVAVTRTLVLRAAAASTDPLTGLANRRAFDEALGEMHQHTARPLCAVLLDLDHLKVVNDHFGHDAGDALLRRVATAWATALPPRAVLSRHGGDEFALLLPDTDATTAEALVHRLCALVGDVGVSAGIAQHRPHESAAQLMRRADLALYEVKENGRGHVAVHAHAQA